MKFLSTLTLSCLLAFSAGSVVGSIYDLSALPDGTLLPRANVHPLTDQRRREIIDSYFANNPEKRSLYEDEEDNAAIIKRHSKRAVKKCKHKKKSSSSSSGLSVKVDAAVKTGSDNKDGGDNGVSVVTAGKGLIGVNFNGAACSNPHATADAPNGDISFLNCGISKSNPTAKWNPPPVKLSQLKYLSSDEALKKSIYQPCIKYKSAFDAAAKATKLPAVLLMAIAMQESTCNPQTRGQNGEIGMMQLTPDKCKGKNCWDASVNVMGGAQYFKQQLDENDGNMLVAAGNYNGWQKGYTSFRAATAAASSGNCFAQNNLDYLNQLVNGWFLGKDAYKMTVYNNLAKC